jgi:DNA-directed RNA polymerase subunit RPC12/RpoP
MSKTVRTKTVEEVTIKDGMFVLYQRRKEGVRCGCLHDEPDPNRVCRQCYGVGLDGGYYDAYPAQFRNASYEEELKSTVTEGNMTTTSEFLAGNEWNMITFECSFEVHIYYQCILELDLRLWSVVEVEQVPDDEDDDGLPLPERWRVTARKLQEFESGYLFMRDHAEGTAEAYSNRSVFIPADEGGPMLVNMGGLAVGKLLYICPECGANVTVKGPRDLGEEIEDEIHCNSCGHTWSNEEDLKKRGLD